MSWWQIWQMSIGFLGIQVGWGLQMGKMSLIYEKLGASPDQIPFLWLAAPMSGLIIQPIIGYLSDRTWGNFGRRRPYFFTGAILSTIALILMPNSSSLWMAAGLLWILDASINITMEPFRAFVGDMLHEKQRAKGFAFQSLAINIGALIAYGIGGISIIGLFGGLSGIFKTDMHAYFYIGAFLFFVCVLWTVLSTKEYPPDDIEAFNKMKMENRGLKVWLSETVSAYVNMPQMMKKLAWVQMFTWIGLFCMWLFFNVAVARNIFGSDDPASPLYDEGGRWASLCYLGQVIAGAIWAMLLPFIVSVSSKKSAHILSLLIGAAGLISLFFFPTKYGAMVSMIMVGIAWASIVSMPYALLVDDIPKEKFGIYMGIFNMFICIPEIIASLGLGWVMLHFLGNNRLYGVVLGGIFMLIAALLALRIKEKKAA
jgi:maltose/moltooligosaccharide transporter